uniref:Protein TIFY n=3 Tax=Aegilops tauschii TaxID=37682 RepID=A0A453IXF8_AEGTS
TDSAARRFASACGVLSQYVKASGVQEPGYPAGGAQQLTIFYGGRVVVLDGCTPARAAELIRFAAASQGAPVVQPPAPAFVDMPIARKASLQRFLSKRKDRSAGAAPAPAPAPAPEVPPYAHHEEEAPPKKKDKTEASSWLALGSLGDMHGSVGTSSSVGS